MGNLKVHDKLDIQAGGQAEVLDEFGSGGQGTVYKVSYNGKTYALKWYHPGVFKGKENDFYKNLENNISNGAPTDAFLWPKAITKVYNDQFGYLMDVRPSGYEELTNFFVGGRKQKQARFKSFYALCTAAINIIEAFRALHNNGYSYQDIYKKYVDSTNQSLEDFVTAFHDKNLDGSSSNAENQLLGYQQQQTELMKNFATVVSEAVSTSIANTMRTELVPIFDEMKSTVKEFSEIASQQQKDGLNQVVQEFIRCMNESLRGQFDELAETIQKTCEWQKASTEQMQKIVDSICDTSNEIEKVNAVSHQTVEEMNGFVTLLKEYQEKLHSEAELIQQQIANSNEISERQANYLDKLVESESRVADLADNVKKEADAAQQAVDMLSDHCKDQISGIVDAAKQDMDALAASTKVLTEASHSQMETLAQTAESEMQLLSNTAAQLSEENHKQLMELTKASSEQMSVISEAANNVMQNSKQQIEEAIKATQAQSDALMQATNDFSDFVQQEHKKLVEAVDKEVSGLSNFAGQTTSEIQSATAGMENAAKLLDKNLDDVLDRTFTSFDSSLTDISQHLSGTIADVRDTTEALPHVIRESTKQYEAVLAKLTSQTQSYLDAMEKLTALVEQKAPAVADEEGNRQ